MAETQLRAVADGAAPDMALTELERDALMGANDRAALVELQYQTAMRDAQERINRIFAAIAARVGLPANAFGAEGTHDVDPRIWRVIPRAVPDAAPAIAPPAPAAAAD